MTRRPSRREDAVTSRKGLRPPKPDREAARREQVAAKRQSPPPVAATTEPPPHPDQTSPDQSPTGTVKQTLSPLPAGGISVELNDSIDGWPIQSRFDVVLRGRIISAAPVDSLMIHDAAGLELVAVQFGHGDAQIGEALPGGETRFCSGFQLSLPLPGGDEGRIADLWVRARARDGAVFEEGMRLGCMADQAAILAGPARDMAGQEIPAPRGMVYLETAEISADGRLLVHGWSLATSPVVAVQIFVDGQRVGAAIQSRVRGDVADAYPGYPNSGHAGFALERKATDTMLGAVHVTAQVLCLSGACHAATIPLSRSVVAPTETAPAETSPAEALPPGALQTGVSRSAAEPVSEAKPAQPAGSKSAKRKSPAAEPREPGAASPTADASGKPDSPVLLNCDHAIVTADGGLLVDGWAASRHGIERVVIEIDGRPAGDANYGRERPDVAREHSGI